MNRQKERVAEVLRTINELPAEDQSRVSDELQKQELDRLSSEIGELPMPELSAADLDAVAFTLDEAKEHLLKQIDYRIEACNRLKEYVRTAGDPATKEGIRELGKQARADSLSEKGLRDARSLFSDVLRGTMQAK